MRKCLTRCRSDRSLIGVLRPLAIVFIAGAGIAPGLSTRHAAAQVGGFNLTLNAQPSSVATGQSVTFNYSASPPVTSPPFPTLTGLTLAFGDGSSQSLPIPLGSANSGLVSGSTSHIYSQPGTFTAVLTATDSEGHSGSTQTPVQVTSPKPPIATLSGTPLSVTTGANVTFTGSATAQAAGATIVVASLQFADGQSTPVTAAGFSVTHSYGFAGTYGAVLTATDSNNQKTTTPPVTIQVSSSRAPLANLGTAQSSIVAGGSVTFTGNATAQTQEATIASTSLQFGDGQSAPVSAGGFSVSHSYASAGSYGAVLTATDSNGQAGTSVTVTIQVATPKGPVAGLNVSQSSATPGVPLAFTGSATPQASGATITSAVVQFGDGQTTPVTAGGFSVTHAYASTGSYSATLTATDSNSQTATSTPVTIQVNPPAVSGQPLTNVQIVTAPAVGAVGQELNFAAARAGTPNTGASIATYVWSWGDGSTAPTQSTTAAHAYGSAGTYQAGLTVTDTSGVSSSSNPATVQILAPSSRPSCAPAAQAPAQPASLGALVGYQAGWGLAAGPSGSVVSGIVGPVYTLAPGAQAYDQLDASSGFTGGCGYWVYFAAGGGSNALPPAAPQVLTVQLPAGQYSMIGNPGTGGATIIGADSIVTYSPSTNTYTATTVLAAGQGAWAYSANGATVSIVSGG